MAINDDLFDEKGHNTQRPSRANPDAQPIRPRRHPERQKARHFA